MPFLLVHDLVAWWQLTSANYVEHYGLLLARLPSGVYEAPQPHHSWNTNHLVTNLALFHLQRHSDHHAHPSCRYQSLRHFEQLPQLPSGYFEMFPLSYVPWLWFKVMDPRLLALPDVAGDLARINIDPFAPEPHPGAIRRQGQRDPGFGRGLSPINLAHRRGRRFARCRRASAPRSLR